MDLRQLLDLSHPLRPATERGLHRRHHRGVRRTGDAAFHTSPWDRDKERRRKAIAKASRRANRPR